MLARQRRERGGGAQLRNRDQRRRARFAAMTKPATLIDHARRIARVHEHIAARLDAAFDLDQLAGVASLSRWHFHRVYRETTGETVAGTVRRLRLHRAAVELVGGERALSAIARRAGYGSLAAFARAFAADYGVPPGTYRLRGRIEPPRPSRDEKESAMYEIDSRAIRRRAACRDRPPGQLQRNRPQLRARRGMGQRARPRRTLAAQFRHLLRRPAVGADGEAALRRVRGHSGRICRRRRRARARDCARRLRERAASRALCGARARLPLPLWHLAADEWARAGRPSMLRGVPRSAPPTEWTTRVYLPLKA
jgi:AraC-like DNA-binding protein